MNFRIVRLQPYRIHFYAEEKDESVVDIFRKG